MKKILMLGILAIGCSNNKLSEKIVNKTRINRIIQHPIVHSRRVVDRMLALEARNRRVASHEDFVQRPQCLPIQPSCQAD